jgi:hypothetical protein
MSFWACLLFLVGATCSLYNGLRFPRFFLRKWRGLPPLSQSPLVLVSSLCLPCAAWLLWENQPLAWTAIVLAVLDTGGIHFFLFAVLWFGALDRGKR